MLYRGQKRGIVQALSPLLLKFLLSLYSKASSPSRARLIKLYIYKVRAGQGGEVSGTLTLLFTTIERSNIQNSLNKLAFYKNTIILELLERLQGISLLSITNSNCHRDNNKDCGELPQVSNFVNNFALITTGLGRAPNVTATCLEREELPVVCFTI